MSVATIRLNFTFLLIIGIFCDAYGVVVGSDSACSRQCAASFLQADSDNEMNGFASFETGFTLESASTTCTFDSFFPVSGTVDMHRGILYLQKDLLFDEGVEINGLGSLYGNGHKVEFSKTISTLMTSDPQLKLTQVDQITPATTPVNSVDWSPDGTYVTAVIDSDPSYDIFVYSFNRETGTFSFAANAYLTGGGLSVRWNPAADYIAVGRDPDSPDTTELRVYPFNRGTNQLGTAETVSISGGNVSAVSWYKDGTYLAIGTTDASQYVKVYQFSLGAGTIGMPLTVDTQPGGAVSNCALDWDITGSYLAVGVSNGSGSELLIYYLQDETTLTLTHQTNISGVTTVRALDWCPTDSLLAVGLSDDSERLRAFHFDYSPDNWTLEEKTAARVGEAQTVQSVHWDDQGNTFAVGLVNNAATEIRVYELDTDYSSDLKETKEISTSINDVRWDYDGSYVVSGDEALHVTAFSVYEEDVSYDAIFDSITLSFNADVLLQMNVVVQNNVTIDGRGNRMTLDNDASISVASGSQLTLKNIELAGIIANKLSCADNTASLVLKNCTLRLAGDTGFQVGAMEFVHNVVVVGDYTITFSSSIASTIALQSALTIDQGTTFKYAPTVANRDLLVMTDKSSILHLNGCTLQSTATGIRLTKGRLFLDNHVTFSCAGTDGSQSICFGDGIAANDLDIKLLSGAKIDVYGGICYDNVV